jgi:acetyl esterase
MTTTSQTGAVPLPGRLGNPALDLRSDPRADPRMIAALATVGMDTHGAPLPVDSSSPRAAQLEYLLAAEEGFETALGALMQGLPPVDGVISTAETIAGPDGNDITLYISRPAAASGALPCVLQIHGGGMVIISGAGPVYARLREELAATGLVVVGVEYRNGAGVLGTHPFPAGLDDCTTALKWVHEHRAELGVSKVVIAGESGGANLSLATTMRAKRDGHLEMIDGVYAMVPYISGIYGLSATERAAELPSLVENDGYFTSCALVEVMVEVYDPGATNATNPLCWPYHATTDDLAGLPPHVVSVCELDPLRDEGLVYHRKLLDAGVESTGRIVASVCHAGDVIFRAAMPDVYAATVSDIHRFAASR